MTRTTCDIALSKVQLTLGYMVANQSSQIPQDLAAVARVICTSLRLLLEDADGELDFRVVKVLTRRRGRHLTIGMPGFLASNAVDEAIEEQYNRGVEDKVQASLQKLPR